MNTFGTLFRITTWGESHGKALGVVIDGCPSNIPIDVDVMAKELSRRKPGQSAVTTGRDEKDTPELLSGIFEGKTTGHPISVIVWNKDADSKAYENLKELYRPGHADFTYEKKYGMRDYRGGGRSSGRETLSRVIAGSIAKQALAHILKEEPLEIIAYAKQIGSIQVTEQDANKVSSKDVEQNTVRTVNKHIASLMEAEILKAKEEGDSIGGIIEVRVRHCPVGLGAPVFHKLKADLTGALMSIGAVVGVEYGAGFAATTMKGSTCNDPLTPDGFATNKHGGILGGISTGEDIILRIAVKPTASIQKQQQTITKDGKGTTLSVTGRHDLCLVPRIIPVVDNMVAIVLLDHVLLNTCVRG